VNVRANSTRGQDLIEPSCFEPKRARPGFKFTTSPILAESLARGTPAADKIALTIASDTVREIV
jgi:hypothetical protein